MAGRSTVYNKITTQESIELINQKNKMLCSDFVDYMKSIDRSPETIKQYAADLNIFFVWNLQNNENKYFVELTKREVARFQSYAINTYGWSPKRTRRVKSVLSSLSNFIESILDEEIKDFKPIIRKIENPVDEMVREKTILTDEQVDFLLDKLVEDKKYQVACAVALALYSGARKAELPRFKVQYFNDSNIIFDSMWRTPEKIKTKGRGGKIGKPLYKYVLIDFRKYFDLWMEERKRLGIYNEYLLLSVDEETGEYIQMKTSTLDSYAVTCTRILGVPYYFHSARHKLTTLLSSKYNLPAKVIQEFFGWNSQEMIGIYDDSEAVDDFGKYFSKDGITKAEQGSLSSLSEKD